MPKKVLVALPPGLLEQIDFVSQCEHRTRSDLIREALRRYINAYRLANRAELARIQTQTAVMQRPPVESSVIEMPLLPEPNQILFPHEVQVLANPSLVS